METTTNIFVTYQPGTIYFCCVPDKNIHIFTSNNHYICECRKRLANSAEAE